jgi:uncharacterized protein YcbX
MITLPSLIYYPIKACRGFEVETSLIERRGLEHDRRMMLVTPEGKFLTQREHPKLALVTPKLEDGLLTLSAPHFDAIQLGIQSAGTPWPVNIWKSEGVAEDIWKRIRIGDIELAVVKPCARCVVMTIDQQTLERSREPLKTLGKFRKHELGAIFGQNAVPVNEGSLRLGMSVEVLS